MATIGTLLRADVFVASCPAGTAIGDMVYVSGPPAGGLYTVDRCDFTAQGKRPVGMAIQKVGATVCQVQTVGRIQGVYSGLTAGSPLFVGPGIGSRLVQAPPSRPTSGVQYHQFAGWVLADDTLLLALGEPIKLQSS